MNYPTKIIPAETVDHIQKLTIQEIYTAHILYCKRGQKESCDMRMNHFHNVMLELAKQLNYSLKTMADLHEKAHKWVEENS